MSIKMVFHRTDDFNERNIITLFDYNRKMKEWKNIYNMVCVTLTQHR